MNLFSEFPTSSHGNDTKSCIVVLIVSNNDDFINRVNSHLFRHGYEESKVQKVDFFESEVIADQEKCSYMIIDISSVSEVDKILEHIRAKVRIDLQVVLMGESDSISFSQELYQRNYCYLNSLSQNEQLAVELKNSNNSYKNNAMNIIVMGTKGGIGLTRISWSIAEIIAGYLKLPLLYVQGNSCTPDIDILTNTRIERDNIIQKTKGTLYAKMNTFDSTYESIHDEYKSFNVVVHEESIKSGSTGNIDFVVSHSNVAVIVVSRDAASLKVGKNYLVDLKNQQLARQKESFRIFIILNDYKRIGNDVYGVESIEAFLGVKIDLHIPYSTKKNESIDDFCLSLIGLKSKGGRKKRWWKRR